jgi:hypothetical protein
MRCRVTMPKSMVAAIAFASANALALGLMLLAPPSHAQTAPSAATHHRGGHDEQRPDEQ